MKIQRMKISIMLENTVIPAAATIVNSVIKYDGIQLRVQYNIFGHKNESKRSLKVFT